jgi:RHS repeat-associated protein
LAAVISAGVGGALPRSRRVGNSSVDTRPYFIYDGNQIVLQIENTNNVTARHLWGPAVDQLLASEQVDSLFTPGETLWPLADHLGTPRHHAQFVPEEGQTPEHTEIVNTLTYDTYGNLTDQTGTTKLLFGYTSRPFDEATKLQNNVYRWYEPPLGVWLSEDPITIRSGDVNFHRYVSNAPTFHVDPNGLEESPLANTSWSEIEFNATQTPWGWREIELSDGSKINVNVTPEMVQRMREELENNAAEIAEQAPEHQAKMAERRRRVQEEARRAEAARRGARGDT